MYFDQLLLTVYKWHVEYSDQLLGAAHYTHFISYHDTRMLIYLGQNYDFNCSNLKLCRKDKDSTFEKKIKLFCAENQFPYLQFTSANLENQKISVKMTPTI